MTSETDILHARETGHDVEAWSRLIPGREEPAAGGRRLIGVLPGEGIGPEVTTAALRVLAAVEHVSGTEFDVMEGGPIGHRAIAETGSPLPPETIDFCAEIFSRSGAVLAGPGGGRFVYELRRRFDLFCKINPVRNWLERRSGGSATSPLPAADLIILRENVGGVYQGRWREDSDAPVGRLAEHSFSYDERQVRRILEVAAAIAAVREGTLSVVVKTDGVPSISRLWQGCAEELCTARGIRWESVDVDLAAYLLVDEPRRFDVVVAPNLFGDILNDLSAVLGGGRALSCSGNFDAGTAAVFQTNHGAARDLAGTDRANPAGQMFALAMLLRESFGLAAEADILESAVRSTWSDGRVTADLADDGVEVLGTADFAELVVEWVERLARRESA